MRWKAGGLPRGVHHGVQRIADHNHHRVGRVLCNLFRNAAHNLHIGRDQIIAAHARLARQTRGDHHHIAVDNVFVIACANHGAVKSFNGRALHQVQRLALGHAFALWNIQQHNVAQLLGGGPMRASGSNISSTNDRYFRSSHVMIPFVAAIAGCKSYRLPAR